MQQVDWFTPFHLLLNKQSDYWKLQWRNGSAEFVQTKNAKTSFLIYCSMLAWTVQTAHSEQLLSDSSLMWMYVDAPTLKQSGRSWIKEEKDRSQCTAAWCLKEQSSLNVLEIFEAFIYWIGIREIIRPILPVICAFNQIQSKKLMFRSRTQLCVPSSQMFMQRVQLLFVTVL